MGKIHDTHFLSFKIFVNNLTSMESRPIIARRSSSRISFCGSSIKELILRYAVKFAPSTDVAVKTDQSRSTGASSMSSFGTRTFGYVNDADSERRTFLTSPSLTIPPTPPPSPPLSSSPQSASFVTDIYDCFVVVLRVRSFHESEDNVNEENNNDDDDEALAVTERWIKLDTVLPYLGLSWQSFQIQPNYDGMILSWGHLAERVYGENWIAGRRLGETDRDSRFDGSGVNGSGTFRRDNFDRVTWDTIFVRDYLFLHLALNSRNWNFTLVARSLLDEILPTLFHYKITPTISRCVKKPPPIPPKKLKRVQQHSRFDEETFFLRRRCYFLDKRIASLEDKLRDLIIDQCRELGADASVTTAATDCTDDTAPPIKTSLKGNVDISKTSFSENVDVTSKFQPASVESAACAEDRENDELDESRSLYATISERNQADEKLTCKVTTKKRGWRVGPTFRKIDSLKLLRSHRCHEHQRLRSRCSCSKTHEDTRCTTRNEKKVLENGSAILNSTPPDTDNNDEKILSNNETNVNCRFEETRPMCFSSKEASASLSAISSSRMFKRFFFLKPFSWKR